MFFMEMCCFMRSTLDEHKYWMTKATQIHTIVAIHQCMAFPSVAVGIRRLVVQAVLIDIYGKYKENGAAKSTSSLAGSTGVG